MPLKDGSYKGANWATRRSLIEMLKRRGKLSSQEMATELGVSSMAVRQHMQELEAAGEAVSQNLSRGKGRPTKFWALTSLADRHFPDRHRDLMLDLFGSVRSALGEEALEKLLDERGSHQAEQYARKMESCSSLEERVERLAEIRTEEGYLAEASRLEDGSLQLVENHCPICAAARACGGLCSRELRVFERVLGPGCRVERVEHMLADGRRCAYRISPESSGR